MLKNTFHKTGVLTVLTVIVSLCSHMMAQAQELCLPKRWDIKQHGILPLYRLDTLTIRFLGDVMMHSKQIEEAGHGDGEYDFNSYFALIKDKLSSADMSVANMEFTLGGKPYTGYPAFSAPDAIASYAAGCGIDVFLMANNHIFDRGKAGAQRTLEQYKRLGIMYTGLASDDKDRNHPLIVNIKGIRLAFINCTYATNGGRRDGWPKVNYMDDRKDMLEALEQAEAADITVALPHWGNEYELLHSPKQEETARWLAENGADMIIGAHPHVVQDTMTLKTSTGKVAVAYSLGNAVSNMSAENTQLELMATMRIVRHCNGDIELLPLELDFLWCSRPGGFNDRYTVVPVKEYMNRREIWKGPWDYDRMMQTYGRVMKTTGITDIYR